MTVHEDFCLRLAVVASEIRRPGVLAALRADARAGRLDVRSLRALRKGLNAVIAEWDEEAADLAAATLGLDPEETPS